MRQRVSAMIVAGLFAVLSFGSAAADPLNNPNAFQFTDLVCDNGQTVTIVTTNMGAAGQIVTDTGVLIFRDGTITVRDANDPDTMFYSFTFSIGKGKQTGLQRDLVTCTTTESRLDPETGQPVQVDYETVFTFVPRGKS